MSDPRPPATPPHVHKDAATGEWSDVTAREQPKVADTPTVTASGQTQTDAGFGIPNPFGRYKINRLLGRGGMGSVYLGHDTSLDRPVAIKVPAFGTAPTAGQKERFFREARAVSALHHPNICQVFDVDEEQGILFLTTAFIDGQPLSTHIERGPMPAEKAVELVRRVAEAMHAAHSHGTIHRDLKPANIMIDRNSQPVVMDFGLARRTSWADDSREPGAPPPAKDQGLTQFGSVLGTPAYMPPEQAKGDVAAIGPQSDVYSLGVILYELLTGRRPFVAEDTNELIAEIVNEPPPKLSEFYPWIDKKLEKACLKALSKNPADRFPTMAAFERALKEAVDPELELVVPPPLPTPQRKERPVKKRRWVMPVVWLSIVLATVAICVGGPTLAIWVLIGRVKNTVKEFTEAQQEANAEWKAITDIWQPPPADANVDTLFPPMVGNYRRSRIDTDTTDEELGLTIPGQRAVYVGPNGDEVEVRAYRCPENKAATIQSNIQGFVKSVQDGRSPSRHSYRQKVNYTQSNSAQRTVTFGFSDTLNQNQEYGKVWYSRDWLFYFRTTQPLTTIPLTIEVFPSKYLVAVGKQATAPKPEAKASK
jgi:serine/threonine protein kinase